MSIKNQTVFSISQDIEQRRRELVELEAQLEVAKAEPTNHALARELHSITCTHNHTDGCSWFYEFKNKQDDWQGSEHTRYLQRANLLISECERDGATIENVVKYFKIMRGY